MTEHPATTMRLTAALADAGGTGAPPERTAQLRRLLADALDAGRAELARPRSGYGNPVVVALAAAAPMGLVGIVPVAPELRADPAVGGERAWLLTAALTGALVEAAGLPPPAGPPDLVLRLGRHGDWLAVAVPLAPGEDLAESAELAVLAFGDQVAGVDRLRACALAMPPALIEGIEDLRAPPASDHPLRAAEAVARLGGRPADPDSVAQREEAVLALLEPTAAVLRPHADPEPARRVARRVLQRLAGMGKWGGYHTEYAHLARGFAGHDRALALEVGERLLDAGLLREKPSVGQRHVFLDPRRAADIHRLIDEGVAPPGLKLPGESLHA